MKNRAPAIYARTTPAMLHDLEGLSRKTGLSVADHVRIAVRNYLAHVATTGCVTVPAGENIVRPKRLIPRKS